MLYQIYSGPKEDKEKALEIVREAKTKYPNDDTFAKLELGLLIDLNKIADAKEGLEYALMSSCIDRNQFACGFRKSGRHYTKQIQDRWSGRRKTVKI